MNLSSSQAEVRLREDVKATKTIAITIAAYFFCFIPTTVFTAVVYKEDDDDDWLSFTASSSIAFSSTVNPIIYFTRTRRYLSAFKQLLKNPFGSSNYKERSNFNNTRVLVGNRDSIGQENSLDLKMDGNSKGEAYAGKRRNSLAILSTESVRVHEASYYADEKQLSWEGQMSKCGVEAFDQLSGEETKGGHDKLNETKRQKIREQLRPFSKVHSLEVVATHIAADDSAGGKRIESAHHFRREEKRQEFSGKRKGTVSNSLVLLKVRKAAWQATEEEYIGQTMSKPN
mgnify:CR=1 FL=1